MLRRIKICGITDHEDLWAAADNEVDAVGFLVGQKHFADDFIGVSLARELALKAPPFLTTVVVTHETEVDEILAIANAIPSHAIQLHSDFTSPELKEIRSCLQSRYLIGKISVENEFSLHRLLAIQPHVDAILLDSINRVTGQVGGTGMIHDWMISARIRRVSQRPVILAGGLRPTNVSSAIDSVLPAAVDVNSGVENSYGKKDPDLVAQFVAAVRRSSHG